MTSPRVRQLAALLLTALALLSLFAPLPTKETPELSLSGWWLLSTRQAIWGSLGAVAVAALLGLPLGSRLSRGSTRGLGWLTTRLIDALGPLPTVILAGVLRSGEVLPAPLDLLAVVALFKSMDITQWVQSHGRSLLEAPYVRRSRALGASPGQTFRRHVLPELWIPLRWQAATTLAALIALDAGLELCGFGASPAAKGWGAALVPGAAVVGPRGLPAGSAAAALASLLLSAACLWIVSQPRTSRRPQRPALGQKSAAAKA